jgi:hypothetical protein
MKTPNYNYTSVDPIIVERIRRRCEELNYELAFTTKLSCHPDDDYLYIVIAQTANSKDPSSNYILWEYNADCNNLYWGHYNINFKEAMRIISEKINWY